MHRLYNKIDALKAAQENIMSHSHSEQKVLLWRHIMNIYELFSGLQWQGRKLCGFQKLHCQRRPDFPRAKLVILSHADWFECIWMTVLTSPGIGSCLCDQPASELHFKESPIFIALTLEDSHLYAALTVSFQRCNRIKKNINKQGIYPLTCYSFSENVIHDGHAGRHIQQKLFAASMSKIHFHIETCAYCFFFLFFFCLSNVRP